MPTFNEAERKRLGLSPWCSCGSGEYRSPVHDARGIFLTYVCDKCRREKLSHFRPEVLTDSNYWHDEPIDGD